VSLVSPAGTEVLLHNRTGGSDDSLVRTFTATNTPALGVLTGQSVAGAWRLRVVDHEAQDVGKLNSWRVLIKP
jgi:subtilisin-like proprotein convertase family protein